MKKHNKQTANQRRRTLLVLTLIGLLTGVLVACSSTPEATEAPPTQTPWIVVVTSTSEAERIAEAQPTQTPWIIVATPTQAKKATAKPAKSATAQSGGTKAKPSPTTAPSATAAASQTEAPPTEIPPTPTALPTATSTPAPGDIKYPAPVPLDPPPEGRVSWRSRVLLKWTPVEGGLAEDEYYRLEFDRPPTTEGMVPYGDYVFVKESDYLWEKAALAPFHPPEVQGDAVVYWWVRVVRKTGEDENGKPVGVDISSPSVKWVLILEPKPEGE